MAAGSHSSVWRRTVYYFLIIVGIFLVSSGALLYLAGFDRADKEMLVEVTRADLNQESRLLLELKRELEDANASPATLKLIDARLMATTERLDELRKLRELELTPKTAKNQQEILTGIERGYGELRAAWEHDEITLLLRTQFLRFGLVLLFFFLSIAFVMYILIKMILTPLETLIQNARRVSQGDVEVSFHLRTNDELGELSSVLGDLSSNFRELLTLMKSSSRSGKELTEELATTLTPPEDGRVDLEDATAKNKAIRILFQKIEEITEYFTFSRVHR
jgi:nitrogen fixation/metabolism regulation signal transduction histidine kinase